MYTSRAQANRNGSFTVSLRRDQRILADSIRGFQLEKGGTTWKGSTIELKFHMGNSFKDDTVVEAELVLTSRLSAKLLRRRYNVSVYHEQSVLVPNDTRLLDSRTLPGKANAEFGLNVTQAVRMWSSSLARTYTLLVKIEPHDDSKASLSVWRYLEHGHMQGPFLVLYTQSKQGQKNDDIWRLLTINWLALSPVLNSSTAQNDYSNSSYTQLSGKNTGRSPRNPSLTCHKVSFAMRMQDIYQNIVVPQTADINYCDGYCYFPIQNHLTPTMHAITWALIWKRQNPITITPKRPMCVPSKLIAQTVIQSDPETGQPVQKQWLNFSAPECGCR
ncbi:Growth/differentiation factor 2 [Stylophora pistillata]|uniref:Growth/differentiation factor 2 n=2 Tax=Stylophora pistillata TaxID=50429 RepID=A0A2B4R9P1_STYPI|nr:Growth/differentiation factor 2 [Stylophora pistillata]